MEFSMRQKITIGSTRFKPRLVNQGFCSVANGEILRLLRLLYSNVRVNGHSATINVGMNVPERLVDTIYLDDVQSYIRRRANSDYRFDEVVINISVTLTQVLRYSQKQGMPL